MTTLSDGARVRVKDMWPEVDGPVHVRTPHYVRGQEGVVVRRLGAFPNPEDLAFARPAPEKALYHVAFPLAQLWPGGREDGNELVVEIFEHWLESIAVTE